MIRIVVLGLMAAAVTVLTVSRWRLSFKEVRDENANGEDLSSVAASIRLGNLSDVRFLLWTRSNPDDHDYYRLLPGNLTNLNESPINPSLPTHIMYHGFNDHGECGWILGAKRSLLELYDCNIISVDWQTLVPSPWYNFAFENTFKIASYTGNLIDWINAEKGLRPSQVHIVGHSLGGHAAGLTGKRVTSGQVARITGLDPAGPLFYAKDSEHRIDKSDAAYVDVIHANSGSLLDGCIALFESVGHVDFYPNGGHHQPGCEVVNGSFIDDWTDLFEGCSHARVTALWVESIAALDPANVFKSWPCSDYETFEDGFCQSCGGGCPDMGFHVNQSLHGEYFLRTNAESPFARGDHR